MKNYHLSVGVHLNEDNTLLSTVIQCGIDSDNFKVCDSTFKLDSVMPKTVHAVVCSAVSDALASSFNALLSSKEDKK